MRRGKNRTVRLSDAPASAQIIKVVSPVLPVIQVLGKRRDYVIIDAQNSQILLIELKLGTTSIGKDNR